MNGKLTLSFSVATFIAAIGVMFFLSDVRGRLARELSLKRTPELRFRYDPSLALGTETLSLLRSIADDEKT